MKTTYFDNNLIDKLKNCYDFKKGHKVIEANRGFIKKRKDGSEIVNYNDDDFPSYIYYGYIFKGCTWERVPHYHDDMEFLTVTSGEMDYVVNGFNIHLKNGETIFVNSNNVHYSAAPNEGVARYVIAVLHPKIICSAPVVEEKAIKPIVSDKSVPFVHFEAKDFDAPVIHKLLVDMEKEAKENADHEGGIKTASDQEKEEERIEKRVFTNCFPVRSKSVFRNSSKLRPGYSPDIAI